MSTTDSEKRSTWSIILKIVIAVATALAGVLGITACCGGL